MGLGGNLMWTAVLREIERHDGQPPIVCHRPQFSDLLMGRLNDRTRSLAEDPVFRRNPRITFVTAQRKSAIVRLIDSVAMLPTKIPPLRRIYERAVARRSDACARRGAARKVHVDMVIHSYAARQLADRFLWKPGGHASEVIAKGFGITLSDTRGELYFEPAEEAAAVKIRQRFDIDGPYLVLEPGTNQDWFGDLRAWPLARWQALVAAVRTAHSSIAIVQVGVPNSPRLDDVIDLRGATTFREAALLIRDSASFIGTEGGLTHAAAAVGARAVILWGGVTLPEFAGYPEHQTTICKYVSCAPCGHLGWCDRDHQCMNGIAVDYVAAAVGKTLTSRTH
jgi:hypothetical protein